MGGFRVPDQTQPVSLVARIRLGGASRLAGFLVRFALQAEPFGQIVLAAQGLEGAEHALEVLAALGRIGEGGQEFAGGQGEIRREEDGDLAADFGVGMIGVVFQSLGVGDHFAEEVAAGLVLLPAQEAAGAPVAEVLFADRFGMELGVQHVLHFGPGVEPLEEGCRRLAVGEALIQFVAGLFGQTLDFSIMGVHII